MFAYFVAYSDNRHPSSYLGNRLRRSMGYWLCKEVFSDLERYRPSLAMAFTSCVAIPA
jgi:hypothetical protein